jgi:hypothetical protein
LEALDIRLPIFAIPLSIHVVQIVVLELITQKFLKALQETYDGNNFIVFGSDNMAAYIAWQYLPMIIAVGVSGLWEELNVTIHRLEPFYQLSRDGGADIKNSLRMDYITAISLFTPFKVAYQQHWVVVLSSLVYVIAFAVLPTLIGQLLDIVWDGEGRGFFVRSPAIARATEGVLGVVIVLAITLVMIQRRLSGLISDPASIGGLASLISHSSVMELFQTLRPYENQDGINSSLKGARFGLDYIQEESGSGMKLQYQISARSLVSQSGLSVAPPFKQRRRDAHSIWLWGRIQLAMVILMAAPNVVVYMAVKSEGNFPPRIVKALFTLSTVVSTALWQVWQREVSSLEPCYQLSKLKKLHPGTPHALHYDFIASSSLGAFFKSLGRRCFIVSYISLCGLLIQMTTIVYPVMFDNAFAIIVADQHHDLTHRLFSPLMLKDFNIITWAWYPLILAFAIGWILLLVTRRKPFLPGNLSPFHPRFSTSATAPTSSKISRTHPLYHSGNECRRCGREEAGTASDGSPVEKNGK